jgi:anthranilate 1,2-dioxygenase small subunit
MKSLMSVPNSLNNSSHIEPGMRERIEEFLNDYCHRLDDGKVDDWTSFFAEDANYQITTRENVENGYPLGIMYCEGRGMMEDRIKALKTANIFESHAYCHILGRPQLWNEGPELYGARSNFTIYRTMYNGEAEVFATGKYLDLVFCGSAGPVFKKRMAIVDSRRIDTLLVLPI